MGGQNHQPTTRASAAITVPMSKALSRIGNDIGAANVAIEEAIMAESGLSYGAGRGHLGDAVIQLDSAVTQIGVFSGYVGQMLAVLGTDQYEPFVPATFLDLDEFFGQLVDAGLIEDSAASRGALEIMREGSYTAAFQAYLDDATLLADQVTVLRDRTANMRDGQAGLQGMFWQTVEGNRVPWRQAFAMVLTRLGRLNTAFLTGALISTETYLRGTDAPGLLANVSEVTLAPRNADVLPA